MAERTWSEQLFERYCQDKGIPFERIPEAETKTPDYRLKVANVEIVVEVKECGCIPEPGKDGADEPGKQVRQKITDAGKQIRAYAKSKYPAMLVLYDFEGRLLYRDDIKVAMYGAYTVRRTVPRQYDPSISGRAERMHGGGRKMTKDTNTSISAVAALWMNSPTDIQLHVCHNEHAAVPIEPSILKQYGIPQT